MLKIALKILLTIFIFFAAVFLVLAANWIHATHDFGYPGGEAEFIGLTKEEVVVKIDSMRLHAEKPKQIIIAVGGYNYKYFDNPKDVLNNQFVRNANVWGVNHKSRRAVFYDQILHFDESGKVESQNVKRYYDGL